MIHQVLQDISAKEGDVFIDVGACKGEEARAAQAIGMEVHSFEPNKEAVEKYLQIPGVKVIQAACGKEGKEKFYSKGGVDIGATITQEKLSEPHKYQYYVDVINLGKYLQNLDKDIKILKIDAEGEEFRILETILDNFDPERIEYYYVESHIRKIPNESWREHAAKIRKLYEEKGIVIHEWQ